MSIVHPPRVAWRGARVFVAAAGGDVYWWLSEMVGRYLDLMLELHLAETRARLRRSADPYAEIGLWRVHLETLLDERPELHSILLQLIGETEFRLAR